MAREKPTFEELEKKVQALESSEARRKKAEKKLVKKEALLNEILRLTKVGGWEYDIDTGETVWTDEVYRIHELPVDHNIDHMSMSVKCYQAEDRPLIQKAFKQAVEKGKPYDLELKFITAKGNPRWVRTTAKASRKGSKVVRVFGNIEDITERKQVAESLRESEDRLQLAMDAGEHGFWDFNVDTGDVFFSPRYYTMLGYEPGELPRRLETWIDLMHPEDRKTIVPEILQYVENAEPYAVDFRLKCKDGSYKWISGRGKSFQIDDKGIPHRAVGVHVDITERKLAEEALRKSEQILDSIMVNVPDIIYRLDADGKFLFVSDSVGQYGYSPVELLGTSVFDIVHPEDHEKAVYRVNERRTGDRRTISMELRLLTKDQNAVSFEVKSNSFKDAPIFLVDAGGMYSTDEEGEKSFLCTQGIARDISERKKVYREKENLENQLRQAQKMESVGRLAGGVAHDFNNMLSVILGNAEIALKQVDVSSPIHDALQEIEGAGKRSAELTRQLLAFARRQTVSPKVLDLNEVVTGMLKMLGRLIGENIDLAWKPGADLWQVKIDLSQIDQLLANLSVNSRDAIDGVGIVTIETQNTLFDKAYCAGRADFLPGEYVKLSVSDNGCGMDEGTVENIFEPFFTTKSESEGTGLGLSTVYGIVKQSQGFIDVYSEPGHGSTFNIYLPRYSGKKGKLRAKGQKANVVNGCETILLVEDEPAILKMGKAMLENLGYRVLVAGTPGAAIALAQEHSGVIHLLVTDVIMPEMNGRDLAARLLRLYPDIKRLFMSGYTADVIAHHGVLDEGIHFLQKPFGVESLAAEVREALDKK